MKGDALYMDLEGSRLPVCVLVSPQLVAGCWNKCVGTMNSSMVQGKISDFWDLMSPLLTVARAKSRQERRPFGYDCSVGLCPLVAVTMNITVMVTLHLKMMVMCHVPHLIGGMCNACM